MLVTVAKYKQGPEKSSKCDVCFIDPVLSRQFQVMLELTYTCNGFPRAKFKLCNDQIYVTFIISIDKKETNTQRVNFLVSLGTPYPPHLLTSSSDYNYRSASLSSHRKPSILISRLGPSPPVSYHTIAMPAAVRYRESYVEKDRCVRNSTAAPVPGVDVLQGFTLSKTEFEKVFLQAAETMDDPARLSNVDSDAGHTTTTSRSTTSKPSTPGRFGRSRAATKNSSAASTPTKATRPQPSHSSGLARRMDSLMSDHNSDVNGSGVGHTNNNYMTTTALSSSDVQATTPSSQAGSTTAAVSRPFRAPPTKAPDPLLENADDAADYADVCRKHAASLQRSAPPDYDGAGEFFERACDARATHGLFCTPENADAHVEYAQNLSKRGLTPEAEYHLRTAADIYRMMNARSARKYGDVLLYLAVVVDRQARLAEAENFYRSALAVYRANKLSDDNVRVAIDSLSNNLRTQGREHEVDSVIRRHFLGACD